MERDGTSDIAGREVEVERSGQLPRYNAGSAFSKHSSVGTCQKVVRPHFAENILKLFLSDLERTCKDTTLSKNQSPMKTNTPPLILISLLTGLGFLQPSPAVVPPPDGGYPGFNTAEGQNALSSLTTGTGNAAVGAFSLISNTTASFNTAVGARCAAFHIVDKPKHSRGRFGNV